MNKIFFPDFDEILLIHAEIIKATDGDNGLRDAGDLESALKAAENRFNYETEDLAKLAALSLFICRKRTRLFKGINASRRSSRNYF